MVGFTGCPKITGASDKGYTQRIKGMKPRHKHTCQNCFNKDAKMEFRRDEYGYWHYTCECGHTGVFFEAKEVKPYWMKGK